MTRRSFEARPLTLANPERPERTSCDSGAAVVYVATGKNDGVAAEGLALQTQAAACRNYVRQTLHQRVEALFADTTSTRCAGLSRLLSHLAVCHNRNVVMHRLDRIKPSRANKVSQLGGRVLATTGERLPRNQAGFFNDVEKLFKHRS